MIDPRSPAGLLELATGYQRSHVLFAFVELDIAKLLAGGPRTAVEIAAALEAGPVAIDRFLNACVALGLLVHDGGAFSNGPATERYLVRGAPDFLGDVVRHYRGAARSAAWAELASRLRAWRSGMTGPQAAAKTGSLAAEVDLESQHQLARLAGEALGCAFDLSRHQRLLDLGAGTGAMSIALCHRFPALRAVIIEVPAIAERARRRIHDSGLADRIEVIHGDLTADALPEGSDVVLLANVVSMFSAATNRELLRRVFEVLPPGGVVLLSGWMLDDDRTRPTVPVLFCLEDIVLGAVDVEYSATTYEGWLADAGFERIEHRDYFEPARLVIGRKPGPAAGDVEAPAGPTR